MIELTNETFESEVLQYKGVALVDFWATWCGPCRTFIPILNQLDTELPDVKVCKVNVDESQDLAVKYNVSGVPTIIIFKDGELKHQFTGLKTKADLIKLLNSVQNQ